MLRYRKLLSKPEVAAAAASAPLPPPPIGVVPPPPPLPGLARNKVTELFKRHDKSGDGVLTMMEVIDAVEVGRTGWGGVTGGCTSNSRFAVYRRFMYIKGGYRASNLSKGNVLLWNFDAIFKSVCSLLLLPLLCLLLRLLLPLLFPFLPYFHVTVSLLSPLK